MSAADGDPLSAARAAFRARDLPRSVALCREAVAREPARSAAWSLLGTVLAQQDSPEAEGVLRHALALDPGDADALFQLGNVLRRAGRYQEAIEAYETLVRRARHPALLNNLGLAYAGSGDAVRAEQAFREVLAQDERHVHALGNLAHLLCSAGRHGEAVALARRSLAAAPSGSADLFNDLGIALRELGDLDGAAAAFRRALGLAPADPTTLTNLGSVATETGAFDEAAALFEQSLAARPHDLNTIALLAHARQHLCAWEGLPALHSEIVEQLAGNADAVVNPFHLLAMCDAAPLQQAAARRWSRAYADRARGPAPIAGRGDRLRVGYVSSDFRVHPMAFLAAEVWERHDRAHVATFAYALAPRDDSPLRARLQRAFESFRDVHATTDEEIARLIRRDALDVLIDLNGYTTHARPGVLARRAAPLQLHWLGYLGTLGAPWIDGMLTDAHVTPGWLEPALDERPLRLPDCYCPSDTRRAVADPPDRAACGLPPGCIVLACFNNTYKLLPAMFDVWMRVLQQVPAAVLWLSPAGATARRNLEREAAARGVAPGRLVFAPHVPLAMHLARHVHADLYLDTFPYNAGTAANDALFMGVPVLTCSGRTIASRVAGSQVHAAGLAELVTTDFAGYEQCAIALARDPARLRALRTRLETSRREGPLFDMARFTRALETILAGAVNRTH